MNRNRWIKVVSIMLTPFFPVMYLIAKICRTLSHWQEHIEWWLIENFRD